MTREGRTVFEKRRKASSRAIMITLVALALLFYLVSIARILR